MGDTVFVSVTVGVLAGLLPAVWTWCDRHAALTRLVPPQKTGDGSAPEFVHGSEFLQQVARAVRAGATAAQAVASAAPSSPGVVVAQERLRRGEPLSQVLRSGDPDLRTVASCMHHGTVSVHAVEHAIAVIEQERAVRAAVRAGGAMARRSAVVLTALPFVLLGLGSVLSSTVRAALLTPGVIVAVFVGAVLNRAGLAWMTASARRIHREHDRSDRPLRTAAALAAHLRAGGTIATAFSVLGDHDLDCAEISSLLSGGAPLDRALQPLDRVAPGLAEVLITGSTDGLPLAPAVDSFVQRMINDRAALANEQVAELPVRGTAPLVLLVLPSFLLLAVAPVAFAAFRGLSSTRL